MAVATVSIGQMATSVNRALRVGYPLAEVFGCIFQTACGKNLTARQVSKIRADVRLRGCPRDRVAVVTCQLVEKFASGRRLTRGWLGRNFKLVLFPAFEFRLRLRNHPNAHPCMPRSAEFRAGSKVSARLVRLDPEVIRVAGNGIHFAAKVRHPSVVNHISGRPALLEFSGRTPHAGTDGDRRRSCRCIPGGSGVSSRFGLSAS